MQQQQQQQVRLDWQCVARPEDVALTEEDVWNVIERSQQLGRGHAAAAAGSCERPSLSSEEVILNGCGDEDPKSGRTGGSIEGSWIDIAQVIWSSLRISLQHIDSLGLDTVAFGCMALAKKHEAEAYVLLGPVVDDVAARLLWLQQVQWCMSIYEAPKSVEVLAEKLGLEPSHILSYEPTSVPLCPAYFLAVDHAGSTLALVIRGTSQLHDLVADVCGHCVPFFGGYAHCGMLTACRRILALLMDSLEAGCHAYPGYRLTIFGHSLGGGIAALLAVALVNSPELQRRLGPHTAVPQITATSFGAPPVMTLELAQACTAYVTSVVLESDVIARLSVESLRVLSEEMAVCRDEVISASGLLSWARDSAALGVSRDLVKQLCKVYAANKVSALAGAVTRSPTMSAALAAGLTWAGGAIASRAASAASAPPSAATRSAHSAPAAPGSSDLAAAPAASGPSLSSQLASTAASALWSWGSRARDRMAERGPVPERSLTSLTSPAPPPPAAPRPAPSASAAASTSGSAATALLGSAWNAWQASAASRPPAAAAASASASRAAGQPAPALGPAASFSSSLAASMAAAAMSAAAAAAASALSTAPAPAPPSSSKYSLPAPSDPKPLPFTSNPLGAHPPSRPASARAADAGGTGASAWPGPEPEPESQQQHPLHTAGQMYLIKRPVAAADGAPAELESCSYVIRGHPEQLAHRLLIKKSMLQDHFLQQYKHAISSSF